MKLFLDSADVEQVRFFAQSGLLDGITTNPTLLADVGSGHAKALEKICKLVPEGPISVEVHNEDTNGMVEEGTELAKIAPNIVIKVPANQKGILACHRLREKGILVNVTLCFSLGQALTAAKAGATYISPFIGRLEDIGESGIELIAQILQMYRQFPSLETQLLSASIRGLKHVSAVARLGSDAATLPPKVFHQLFEHHMTDKGLLQFRKDWESIPS